MKTLILCLLALAPAFTGHAQQFSGFFRYEQGPRIDYSQKSPDGVTTDDNFPKSAVLHILIATGGKTAQVSLSYGENAKGREDQSFAGVVVHRTNDMISIICVFGDTDKIENYVIYPGKGVGFAITQSAFLGSDGMKALAQSNSEIPFGSVSVFRLRQFKR